VKNIVPVNPSEYHLPVAKYATTVWNKLQTLQAIDLLAPDSGFSWYRPMGKLEHQLVNLRHLQHHAAQLADRVRNHAGVGVDWVSSRAADAAS